MGWIAAILLESPAPPPRWIPTGNERRAQARTIVQRMFESRASHQAWHPGHYLHDLGGAYPIFGGSRFVSGDEVEADLEDELSHLTPPIFQGWDLVFVVALGAALLYVIRDIGIEDDGRDLPRALLTVVLLLVLWAVVALAVGARERELELCQHGVAVRTWIDVWFHRPGHTLEDPAVLEAKIVESGLRLSGPSGSMDVSMTLWPPSTRDAMHDELEAWGIEFGHRHEADHHRRKNHKRP
jgi:hypothetical protein